MLVCSNLWAEDIDLFTGANPAGNNPSTVIIGWHTSANISANVVHGCVYAGGNSSDSASLLPKMGSTVGGMEQCAIVNAIYAASQVPSLAVGLKVGVMVFDDKCGKLLIEPTELTDPTGLIDKIKALDKFNGGSVVGDMFAEAWAVLNGLSGANNSCSGTDYSSYAEVSPDCSDAVFVYIGNAVKETASVADFNNFSASGVLANQMSAFGYSSGSSEYSAFMTPRAVTLLDKSDADKNPYWADEWARFMHSVDVDDGPAGKSYRNVTTYSVAVYDESLQSKDKVAAAMNFIADVGVVGGGKAYKVTANESDALKDILVGIFNEVQDVNSVFSSATLPVSQNNQGTYENQVYVAMFRPDAAGGPRWYGNVKQYQFGLDAGGTIVLADATQDEENATSIVNPVTGGLIDSATSYWSINSPSGVANWPANGFWVNSPEGDNPAFDAPDGDLVQKGAASQAQRIANLTGSGSRKVYTCNDQDSCPVNSSLPSFSTDNSVLMSNMSAILSGGGSSSGLSYSIGQRSNAETISVGCVTKGKPSERGCFVKYDGSPAISSGDLVIISGSSCSSVAPCSVQSVTAEGLKLHDAAFVEPYPTSANFILPKSTFSGSITGGALLAGPQTFENCVQTVADGSEYNLARVTGKVENVQVTSVVSGTSFTASLTTGAAYAQGIVCGSAASKLDATSLVNWVRGDDIAGNESKIGPCPLGSRNSSCPISVRGSIHGDVLHSRPAVVNYTSYVDSGEGDGSKTKVEDVVVFYGANDGHYRAINGNQTRSIGAVRPGGELWSFVAPEFFDKFERQYQDLPAVSYPGYFVDYDSDDVNDTEPRDYFFDGTTTLLQDLRSDTSLSTYGKTFIYLTARRGGALIYALDVSDPLEPKIVWKVTSNEIAELGQTWSQAKVTRIAAHSNPVLVLGGGYDPAEDSDPGPTQNSIGRGILVLDAVNGDVVWAAIKDKDTSSANSCKADIANFSSNGACVDAAFDRAFTADITLVDNDLDGLTDRLYAVDIGGDLWRVDLQPDSTDLSPSSIAVSKLASLGGTGNAARKFLYGPDIIPTKDFTAVVLVSGDREHPLYNEDHSTAGLAYNVQNRFFMLLDRNGTSNSMPATFSAITSSDLLDQTYQQCYSDIGATSDCGGEYDTQIRFDSDNSVHDGYYFNLGVGEKGVNQPVTTGGGTYFATNQPEVPVEGGCAANLGIARGYQVDLFTGSYVSKSFPGGGMPPTAITGIVEIGDERRPFILGAEGSPFKPIDGAKISGQRKRTYWYFK